MQEILNSMLRLTLVETVLTGEAGGGGDDAGGGEDCLVGGEVMDGLVAEGVGLDWVGGSVLKWPRNCRTM